MIVLVVGMHRSGTSMVARGLHALGLNLGTDVDTAPHSSNPHGHWEHAEVWQAQERLLARLGREWHWGVDGLPDRWLEWPDTTAIVDRFAAIAVDELSRHAQWVVKDPRSSLLIPLWQTVARRIGAELKILHVYREIGEVAASLETRQSMDRALAERIFHAHVRSIARDAQGLPYLRVNHREILADPVTQFDRMAIFCGLPPASGHADEAARLVDGELWHHRLGQALDLSQPPPVATDLAIPDARPMPTATALIVMRTRWRQHLLPRGLRSVLAQTYSNWFLQIVNDGGPAHLVEAEIEPYRHLFGGRLGVLHLERQVGMAAAANAAIRANPGEFIAIHDDDATWRPELLEYMLRALDDSGARAVVCRSVVVHETRDGAEPVPGEWVENGPMLEHITADHLADRNLFPSIALVFGRQLYDAVGGFDERLPALGDWHFNKRIARIAPIAVVPEQLARWHRSRSKDPSGRFVHADPLRFQHWVKNWPEPAPLPEFTSQGREVVLYGRGESLAGLPRYARPGSQTGPLPPGVHVILFRSGLKGRRAVLFYRSRNAFSYHESVFLRSSLGELTAVLLNAREPIHEFAFAAQSSGLMALPSDARLYRLADPLPQLQPLAGPPRLPDVLGIGAQRSGTTWLHGALQSHPGVWSCGIKEFHHFDWDGLDERIGGHRQRQALNLIRESADAGSGLNREALVRMALSHAFPTARDWPNYAETFAAAPRDRLVLDFTPAYATVDEEVVADIARVMPDARLLFILRDPVRRSVSGALHQLCLEGQRLTTIAAIRAQCQTSANVLRTDYVRTLDLWTRYFPSNRLLVLFHEDLVNEPVALVNRVCRFLGLDPHPCPEAFMSGRVNRNASRIAVPADALPAIEAEIAQRWLPMLRTLEQRYPEPVRRWRQAAEQRIRA